MIYVMHTIHIILQLIMLYHYYTSIKSKKYEIVLKKENECEQGI